MRWVKSIEEKKIPKRFLWKGKKWLERGRSKSEQEEKKIQLEAHHIPGSSVSASLPLHDSDDDER